MLLLLCADAAVGGADDAGNDTAGGPRRARHRGDSGSGEPDPFAHFKT
eukprot:gene27500-63589_t